MWGDSSRERMAASDAIWRPRAYVWLNSGIRFVWVSPSSSKDMCASRRREISSISSISTMIASQEGQRGSNERTVGFNGCRLMGRWMMEEGRCRWMVGGERWRGQRRRCGQGKSGSGKRRSSRGPGRRKTSQRGGRSLRGQAGRGGPGRRMRKRRDRGLFRASGARESGRW